MSDKMYPDATGFRPSELLLPYADFESLADERRGALEPGTLQWLTEWQLRDMSFSSREDAVRSQDRLSHHDGWHAAMSFLSAIVINNLGIALDESVKLQSHYASILNQYDGGQRLLFASVEQWLDRLDELREG